MKMNISFNFFAENSASLEGGAIKWNDEMPILIDNLFSNNSAIYGENIACFAIRMNLKIYNSSLPQKIIFPRKDEILWSAQQTITYLTNISSGNLMPYILQFEVLDVYGKIVNLDYG